MWCPFQRTAICKDPRLLLEVLYCTPPPIRQTRACPVIILVQGCCDSQFNFRSNLELSGMKISISGGIVLYLLKDIYERGTFSHSRLDSAAWLEIMFNVELSIEIITTAEGTLLYTLNYQTDFGMSGELSDVKSISTSDNLHEKPLPLEVLYCTSWTARHIQSWDRVENALEIDSLEPTGTQTSSFTDVTCQQLQRRPHCSPLTTARGGWGPILTRVPTGRVFPSSSLGSMAYGTLRNRFCWCFQSECRGPFIQMLSRNQRDGKSNPPKTL